MFRELPLDIVLKSLRDFQLPLAMNTRFATLSTATVVFPPLPPFAPVLAALHDSSVLICVKSVQSALKIVSLPASCASAR